MSRSPERIRTGTLGSGPGASASPPEGEGQSLHMSAVPNWVAHNPNGPVAPGGSAARAASNGPCRSATAVFGLHGKLPSSHVVAAKMAGSKSLPPTTDDPASSQKSRNSGSG